MLGSGSVKIVDRDSAELITDGRMRDFMKPRIIFMAREVIAQREIPGRNRIMIREAIRGSSDINALSPRTRCVARRGFRVIT